MSGDNGDPNHPGQRARDDAPPSGAGEWLAEVANAVGVVSTVVAAVAGAVVIAAAVFGSPSLYAEVLEWQGPVTPVATLVAVLCLGGVSLLARTSKKWRRITALLVSGATILVAASILVIWLNPLDDACAPPEELVVATTPDSADIISAIAEGFANGRSAGAECRPVNVTVYAIDRSEDVRLGLADGWDQTLGPLPHVWLPDSSIEADWVRERLAAQVNPEVELTVSDQPTRVTPLIAAVPRDLAVTIMGDTGIGQGSVPDVHDAIEEASGPDSPLVERGDPGGSATALLHTAVLFHGGGAIDVDGQFTDTAAAAAIEAEVRPGVATDSDLGHLCRAADTGGDGPPPPVLTTEAALHRLRTEGGCPGRLTEEERTALVPLYAENLPYLDHPFVRVQPAGVDDGADEIAEAFRDHLTELYRSPEPFTAAPIGPGNGSSTDDYGFYLGYRDADGAADPAMDGLFASAEVPNWEQTPDRWENRAGAVLDRPPGIHPQAAILIAIDTSSSMRDPTALFTTGRAEAAAIAGLSSSGDALGLWTFPRGGSADATDHEILAPMDDADDQGRRITDRLDGLDPDRASTPLADVIVDGVENLSGEWADRPAPPMLVVITDGVAIPGAPGIGIAELEERIADSPVDVRILAVGEDPDPCGTGELPDLDALSGISCVAVHADPEQAGLAGRDALISARQGD
ncbi:hypothetical protein ACFOVU_27520 [Nocardiopsis sediminis]|uniref:VWFA domain-containing protein n=1 Tax=Nocardiopsis sediminis TaxID=1778267 RepID=A0ABV8FYY2_9ACTN